MSVPSRHAPGWRRVLLGVVVTFSLLAGLRWFEAQALFPAPHLPTAWLSHEAGSQGATEHTLAAADGTKLYAWHLPAGGRRVVLWFDGNGASIGMRGEEFARIRALGIDVVQVNYRGYPGSEGTPSEDGLRQDARAAWELATRVAPGAPIVIYGKSLGGGVAVGLAAERPADSLVVESSFASAVRVGAQALPFLPVSLLMKNRFESDRLAPEVRCPTLLLHGTDDEVVPVAHLDVLAAAFPSPPTAFRLDGARHNDALLLDPRVWPTVARWFQGQR